MMVAKHNLSFKFAEHFRRIAPVMFPDSAIASDFKCGKTKTTIIIKKALAPHFNSEVNKLCNGPFSVLVDNSNDRGDNKNLAILVRCVDDEIEQTVTKFLDMPVCNLANAENLFNTIDKCFTDRGLDWINLVAYCSDNASVMIGQHNSVLSRIRQKQPNVFDMGCICHLTNLVIKAALKKLLLSLDHMLVEIYSHFLVSAKRTELYKSFQEFCDV
ncbi:uncharacterized protein LOC121375499 isoform X1 [Gigantopelta aegis]|uniref:uncharacterized protein LOC121375499 isoform X1 n=1 Tax=Gigantopelta aegis TaxID=1735272 RepID=UPI001B889A98|nr:uncharacterized protein LOC121375499 isoform X1 [Gigantopelta aegis]